MLTSILACVTRDTRTAAEAHAVSRRLFAVIDLLKSDFETVVGRLNLTPLQARTILWLDRPSTMGDLADHLVCDASNVTGLADRLARHGLVERVPGRDRRVKLLRLTPKGIELRRSLDAAVAKGSTVMARLTRTERTQMIELLDKVLDQSIGS